MKQRLTNMERRAWNLVSLVLVTGMAVPAFGPAWGRSPSAPTASGSPDREGFKVPFVQGFERPVVWATVNGQGPFKMLLDTGSPDNVLDDDVVRAAKPASVGTGTLQNRTLSTKGKVNVVGIESLSLGKVQFSALKAFVIDFAQDDHQMRGLDGIIGFSTFADYLLTFDDDGKQITLQHGALPPADDREVLNYDDRAGGPELRLRIGNITIDLTIDSSLKRALILSNSFEDRIELAESKITSEPAGGFISDIDIATATLKDSVRLGRYELTEVPVEFEKGPSSIGHQLLKRFAVTFDQKKHRVRFTRNEKGPVRLLPRSRFGLVLTREGENFKVAMILPGSPAANGAVRVGDIITGMESHLSSHLSDEVVRSILRESDGLILKINRGMDLLILLKPQPQ